MQFIPTSLKDLANSMEFMDLELDSRPWRRSTVGLEDASPKEDDTNLLSA
jgi:hypothetical protein